MTTPTAKVKRSVPQLSHAAISRQLNRILGLRTLTRAGFLSRLLQCCVEETLAGNSCQLREQWLGINVFQRRQSFNSRQDPIVRVQSRRLREKLDLYYQTEGMNDDVRISLPVGTYVPVFSTNDLKRWADVPHGRPCCITILPLTYVSRTLDSVPRAAVVTGAIAKAFAGVGGMDLDSRIAPLSLDGQSVEARWAGRTPKTDFAVEGCLQACDDHHVVYLQLTACATGRLCWSVMFEQRYERLLSDARRVAALLHRELYEERWNPPVAV